jgi:predicted O-methyltransferase YrrM
MTFTTIGLGESLYEYLLSHGVREHPVLSALREETARLPNGQMQTDAEEVALLAMLVRAIGARRILEVGTFTGYSSTGMALAMPPDGTMVCCDVSEEWTDVARRAWADAGVADRIELRLGPALETLDGMIAAGEEGSFDLAYIDADKPNYPNYYERALRLVRPGGMIAIDNVLWHGRVADLADQDPSTVAIRGLNEQIAADQRVDEVLVPIGDGLMLARRR